MVQYSVRSIDVSGERTKANYIAGTIAEDIYAFKNQEASNKTFVDSLKDTEWKSDKCEAKVHTHLIVQRPTTVIFVKNGLQGYQKIILNVLMILIKKNLQVIQLCHSGCTKSKNLYFDKMYIGRMEINMQKATKKNIYIFKLNNEKKIKQNCWSNPN